MKGFFNKLLRINLTDRTHEYESIPDSLLAKTLGGKGLGIHYLYGENPRGVDPFAPEAMVIIAVGPVTGTRIWGQSRFGVYAKSPATGGFAESYCGGSLPPKIKGCGIDAIILTGSCADLAYLRIDEEGVFFEDAAALRGKDTVETETFILEHSAPKAGAMVIGPAGENRVRFACLKSDRWRSVGRCGLGAVFGAKNLKGISFAGTLKPEVSDAELVKRVNKIVARKGKESPATALFREKGTPMMVATLNSAGCFPTEYWKSGRFSESHQIDADYMLENCEVKNDACPTCFLRCAKKTRVLKGRHKGLYLEGPEYENVYALGGLNKIDTFEEILYLNDLCDRLGLDTMSAGNMSAFAVEAFRRGKSDFAIDYNQPDKIAELFQMVASNTGFGAILALGIKEASKQLELEDIAIHVKGLEPAGYDPRTLKGMALSYATSARGACHLRGTFYKAELSGQIDRNQIAGKAVLHIDYEDRSAIYDCLILCRFFRDLVQWDELSLIIEAVTGLKMNKTDLEIFANYVTQKTRAYNLNEGLDESTDTLPKRLLTEPNAEGESISEADLNIMLAEYNQIREERSSLQMADEANGR
ncbi:MAG: aldehyde ferredoxin oxidoreductase family protein [bacterium]